MSLIIKSGYREFPPRLEWQPIFYPVLDEDYAAEIAENGIQEMSLLIIWGL